VTWVYSSLQNYKWNKFFIIISLDKVRNELILICHICHINCIFACITLSTRSLNFGKDLKPIETSIK